MAILGNLLGRAKGKKGTSQSNAGYELDLVNERFRANAQTPYFSEAVTHSRSGNATMVDSDGLLKWAPHNLLAYSNDFENVYWDSVSSDNTARSVLTPDGSLSAHELYETSTTTAAYYGTYSDQHALTAGQVVSFSIFAKANERNYVALLVGPSANYNGQYFNLNDGSKAGTEGANFTSSITDFGDGWYRCSVTYTAQTTSDHFTRIILSNDGVNRIYTGVPGSGIYIWGAHLYRSDLGGMVDNPDQPAILASYVPTTSAAVYLPRRGHHVYNGSAWVNEGLLHESEARTNLVEYSEDYSSGDWSNRNVSLTTGQASPDGGTNATLVSATTTDIANGLNFINNSGLSSYTYSVFAKRGSTNWLLIVPVSGTTAWFDLLNGTVETVVGGTATIQDMGGGWYRCAFHSTNASGANLRLVVADGDNTENTTTGNSVYFYGAQLEEAPTPSSYIPTAGATVTRAAETLTIPSAKLPWPTPQYIGDELVTNGTFDTDLSGWIDDNSQWTASGSRAYHAPSDVFGTLRQSISVTTGKVYRITFDYEVLQGLLRCQARDASNAPSGDFYIDNLTGTGSADFVFVPGASFDSIAFARDNVGVTSEMYIDNVSVREINPLSVSIQMDGRVTYADNGLSEETIFVEWAISGLNRILHYSSTNVAGGTGNARFQQAVGGVFDTVSSAVDTYSPGILVPFNIAGRHGSTFVNGAVDGVALTANTTPTALPDLSSTNLELGYDYMGTIARFRVWDVDLGDAGIEEASS